MNEEELKEQLFKWAERKEMNLDDDMQFQKFIKKGISLGFQKGKLEQKKEELKRIIELQKKIRRYLIDNSRCDCLELTTKYGDISDVLFWEYEEQLQKEIKVSGDSLTEFWDNPEDDRWDKEEEKQDDTK